MKRSLFPCLLAGLLFVTGCADSPLRQNPFEGKAVESPYKDLKVALILSENTKRTLDYGNYWSKNDKNPTLIAPQFSLDQITGPLVDMFKRDFKSVVKAEKLADAAAGGADVVAVLDMRPPKMHGDFRYLPWFITPFTIAVPMALNPRYIKVDQGVVFLDPKGRRLDSVRMVTELHRRVGQDEKNWTALLLDAYDYNRYDLEQGLLDSEALKAYADARAKGFDSAEAAIRSDVDEPGYQRAPDEKLLAVVFGVGSTEGGQKAAFAERDAVAVHDHLLAMGYPQRNIALVTGTRAGRAAMEKYVESWLPQHAGPDARVLFYFAGDGAPDAATGDSYLLPYDGDPKFLDKTGYSVKRLYDKLGSLKVAQVTVALDAGFSGTGGRSVLPKGARPLVAVKDPFAPGGLTVMEAASPAETAGVDETQGHGLLTYALLRELNARKGKGSVKSLYDSAAKTVGDMARRQNRDQNPLLLGEGGGSLL